MKTSTRITGLTSVFAFCLFVGCQEGTPTVKSTNCYKATVVAFDCAYIVQLEGIHIGETWHGRDHCATVGNLPADAKVGSTYYFKSYSPGTGPYCTHEKSYDYPQTPVDLFNYSASCSES